MLRKILSGIFAWLLVAGLVSGADAQTTAFCQYQVTATDVAGNAVTASLPSVSGQIHYICAVEITLFAAAALTAAATPVLVTTTNFQGNPTISMSASAQAKGVVEERFLSFNPPWRALAPTTATTIVAPATTNVIWRITVWYEIHP